MMLARTSESSPKDNKVGGHIPTATSALYVVSEVMTRLNRASLNRNIQSTKDGYEPYMPAGRIADAEAPCSWRRPDCILVS